MRIGIIGYGLEGQAAYEYWRDKGEITVCDINEVDVPEGVNLQTGPGYLADISRFDIIVRSPGVKLETLVQAGGDSIKNKLTSNTNEFFKVSPTKNIIGVTGTKGKGTTSALITEILKQAGKTVHLGGNIGVPAISLLNENIHDGDWVVLEMSSFQLTDFHYAPHIGVCLMVVPEHLDWHRDIDDYFMAKTNLFRYQTPDDFAIYYAHNDNSRRIASTGKGWKIPFYDLPGAIITNGILSIADTEICKVQDIGLIGQHNLQNVCAAVTACWQITRDPAAIKRALVSFKGLEHRLEFVVKINGTSYYDDSFATTPESAIVALESFSEPKLIILGGSDKGASYDDLAGAVSSNNVRHVITIGEQGPDIAAALASVGYTNVHPGGENMTKIINTVQQLTEAGDVVLLSPACASFDMFKDYKDRGNQFKQAVLELAEAGE